MRSFFDLPLELLIHVLSALPLRDMQQLMRAGTTARDLCQRFLRRKLDLVLRPYITHRTEFLAMLRHTRSVVSGSTAVDFGLHALTSPGFHPGDLDIYAGVIHAITVIQHLRYIEGYTAIPIVALPTSIDIDDYDGGMVSVVRMKHPGRPKIDIICSARPSALHPLAFFWGTVPMVYLTADGFCSAYPELFFNLKGCIHPYRDTTNARHKRCIAKYSERGFTIDTFQRNATPQHECIASGYKPGRKVIPARDPGFNVFAGDWKDEHLRRAMAKITKDKTLQGIVWECPHVPRRFGDDGCFRLSFEEKDWTKERKVSQFPFEEPEWIMGGSLCEGCEQISNHSVMPWAPTVSI